MVERLAMKALLAFVFCMLLVLPVSTAGAQEGVWEGTKKGVQKGAEGVKKGAETAIDKTEDVGEAIGKGVKKGAETAIDKTEDVGEAVGKGAKDLFTDDDPDSDNDEVTAEGMKTTEPQQRSKPGTDTESSTSATSQNTESETASRDLPRTAGEQPLLVLIGVLALVSAAGLKLVRRLPNSQ
jgi:hypothetical protein